MNDETKAILDKLREEMKGDDVGLRRLDDEQFVLALERWRRAPQRDNDTAVYALALIRELFTRWQVAKDAQTLPPHNLDLLQRIFDGAGRFFTPADRNTLGGLIEYIKARTKDETKR